MSTRFLVTVCTLALLSFPLSAHDADHASDWIGDHDLKNANGVPCCGVSDCAELQDDAVTETHAGYVVDGCGYYHPHASLRWTVGHWESADAGGHWDWIKDYVLKTEPLLAKNGIMIVDDCFYHGDVLNGAPSDAKGVGTKACMDYLATRGDWLRIALPLSNGLFMKVRKKG